MHHVELRSSEGAATCCLVRSGAVVIEVTEKIGTGTGAWSAADARDGLASSRKVIGSAMSDATTRVPGETTPPFRAVNPFTP